MRSDKVKQCWDRNAEVWTQLSRAGYDTYRDHLNTPAFLQMLPEVNGLTGLDIGCGEGSNTRELAARGACMTALDIASIFIQHAYNFPGSPPIHYLVADGEHIPLAAACFDFVTGFMSFMDAANVSAVIAEACRVLKPGGFLQFSISHPLLDVPHHKNLRGADGRTYAYEVGGYFTSLQGEVAEWIFSAAPPEVVQGLPKFHVPRYTHTLSQWLNMLIDQGFVIERVAEPFPDDETVARCPNIQDAQVVPYFLHVRARKK